MTIESFELTQSVSTGLFKLKKGFLVDLGRPTNRDSLLEARNDIEAINIWLARFENANTRRIYIRDTKRFLMWLCSIKGKYLGSLLLTDMQEYMGFLANPDEKWCMDGKRLKAADYNWRPFSRELSKKSITAAISVLYSLFKFLEEADYIDKNPVKLLKTANILGKMEEQKYNIKARMLEQDEWAAVLDTLKQLSSATEDEQRYKVRANLLFSMLYMLGLRIDEASNAVWQNFRQLEGRWWFFIHGKGDKLGHIPVNTVMMQVINNYREIYNLSGDIEKDGDYIFLNELGSKVTSRTLYNIVKRIGLVASKLFKDKKKQDKLKALSPHWLRHLSASHQNKRGVPLTMIRENHRHSSISTTQIYMHSEDLERHTIMEAHSIEIAPVAKQSTIEYYLSVKLSKGPFDKTEAAKIVKNAIESNILKDFSIISNDDLEWKYKTSQESPKSAIDNIKMLCKVWLFEPTIEQGIL